MNRTLRTAPVVPCCDSCVTSGLSRAGFDFTEPFTVYAGLRDLRASARRALVEELIANATGDVILIVSAPIPEECRTSDAASTPSKTSNDDEAAPTAAHLEAMFAPDVVSNE